MHFGIFVEEMRQGLSPAAAFREAFDLAEHAEALGVDCVWLGEIHFAPTRSVISASLQVASSIATRTRRLRVGTAVSVLPLNHPLRIAEEVATLDHISEGRLEFGIGRSGVVRSYDTYGIPYGESQARFREALEIITTAWKGEPFSYQGQFYKVTNATVAPTPYQKPHPPMRMATTSRETFATVGAMGLPSFIGIRVAEIPDLQADLELYRQSWREAGHPGEPSVYLRVPVYVSETEAGAVEEPRESLTYFFGRQAELARSGAGRAGMPAERRAQAERMMHLSYEDILAKKVISGTPPAVIARLREWRDALGIDGIVAEPNPGGRIPRERESRSLELLAREVIPAFR
jgi:alkanesulfonate monooxygenase SsuD/methylene tetrahydromethanopterin reductase-like flavin-dependent oxidoreductase (luciferase family)